MSFSVGLSKSHLNVCLLFASIFNYSFVTKKNIRAGGITKRAKVVDARNKIIQKNRAKIRDAREKLAQITKASGDARLRLLRKRKDVSPKRWPIGGLSSSGLRPPKLSPLKTKPKPLSRKLRPQDLIGVPRGYVDYDNMEMEEGELRLFFCFECYSPPLCVLILLMLTMFMRSSSRVPARLHCIAHDCPQQHDAQ